MAAILGSMLITIYNFLYQPGNITDIFAEFDGYVLTLFSDGWFGNIYMVLKTVGIGMLAVDCLIALMDKVTEGDFTIRVVFRHLLKYVLLYIVLLNALNIFMYLLNIATNVFQDMKTTAGDIMDTAEGLSQGMMTNGVSELSFASKCGLLMNLLVPYIISLAYYIVLYFFATSRLFESVIRITMAPLVAGLSYFGKGDNADIVRFAKRTMGVFFQIVVILGVSLALTFVHESFTNESDGLTDPADLLVEDFSSDEVLVDYDEWSQVPEAEKDTLGAYTPESITDFSDNMLNVNIYPITCGLMIASIFLVFKSREISTRMF